MGRSCSPSPMLGLIALSALPSAACFLGYDSNLGATKRAQQHAAASGPAEVVATEDAPPAPLGEKRVWRVRFRPDAQYLAQTVDAPKQLSELVDDANRILEPSLSLSLVVSGIEGWSLPREPDVAGALAALRADDSGHDAERVVGLIGAMPAETGSLHEAGMATLMGRFLVLRAASRAGEQDAIDRAFDRLSDDERAKVLRQRRRHRALAVFLHELGHSLGALHQADRESLMSPAYDPKMKRFDEGALALMRVALEGGAPDTVRKRRLELLEGASPDEWLARDRQEEIDRLRPPVVAATAPALAPPPAASAPAPVAPLDLSPADRERFDRASELFRAGAVEAAYGAAKPLFRANPDARPVQDLRCDLATVRWLPRDQLVAECARGLALRRAAEASAPEGPSR